MRQGSKTLIAAVVALLVAGLAACGGGDDSDSTATEAASQGQSEGKSSGDATSKDGGGEGKPGGSVDGAGQSGDSGNGNSGDFAPKQHDDSGGGSEQFRAKGGDNSVQEFGEEADAPERDEAAAALHNFLDARAAGDWVATCTYVASSIKESLQKLAAQAKKAETTSCVEILAKLTNPAAKDELRTEAEQADVGSLRVEGDQAFVIYRGTGNVVLAMPMANEDGNWKVASLAGTPLN